MKISSIKLKNIGPYKGEANFNFDTSEDRNIILIGGKNGTGKTTLLNSIKIGLFGCFSFGFKNENLTYLNFIKNMLNYQTRDENLSYIEINFEFIEHYKIQNYTIHREWTLVKDDVDEKCKIYRDKKLLNAYDALELENKVRALSSPALINSFIYDGEKISSIIENGRLELYIKDAFNSIFNIDLLDQLSNDLTSYMVKSYKTDNKSIEYEISLLLNKLNFVKSDIKTFEKNIAELNKEIDNLKLVLHSKKKEFTTLGGLSSEESSAISILISQLEKENEVNNNFIKNFVEEDLYLVMVIKELSKICKQAEKELPLQYAEQLETIQRYLNVNFEEYISTLKSTQVKAIFNLDQILIDDIKELIRYLKESRKKSKDILDGRTTVMSKLAPLKDKIEKNLTTNKLSEISKEIENIQEELTMKTEQLIKSIGILKEKNSEKATLLNKYEQIADNIKKDKLSNSSYIQCTKALKICELFKSQLIKNKLAKISDLTCEIFDKTIRKDNYISKMIFDENFGFVIYDSNNSIISPKLLSAGEMQILVSSIIYAMFKISGRKELFVFDTPLARLDNENRLQFIKNIIATISDQVVVLSTDSEFTGNNLKCIQERLRYKYLLDYNDKKRATTILNEYFGDEI